MKLSSVHRARAAEIFRYLIAGGLNVLCTFAVFVALVEWLGLNYHVALAITWVVGVLLNYAIHLTWVFQVAKTVPVNGPIGKYFVVYAVAFLLNWAMLHALVEYGGLRPLFAQMIAGPLVVVFNYVVVKFVVLRGADPSTRFSVAEKP